MIKPRRIRILSTGGTFEKRYDFVSERLILGQPSCVPPILVDAGVDDIAFESVMSRDSADMLGQDRLAILHAIENCVEDGIVVVHGTSSMVESARYLEAAGAFAKCIVLTGALYPEQVRCRESAFNLGGAVIAAAALPLGVYIVMNGKILFPALAEKELNTGRFVATQ